jgi:DNA polymerase III subunit delta'
MPIEEGFETDRLPGVAHPREQTAFFGHADAEQAFVEAFRAGRLHHAWLIGGPPGVGKATLAYRVARFLLAYGAAGPGDAAALDVPAESTAARQTRALSHPNMIVLRRKPATDRKGPSATIPVESVRRALALFASTAADGGHRICIVDSADDLTASSANALLKLVEEPPERSIFLIVSHAPQRVLPTIRSRCRRLMLKPLSDAALRVIVRSLGPPWSDADEGRLAAAIERSDGSVRRAIGMLDPDVSAIVAESEALLDALPRPDPKRVLALAERVSRRGAEDACALVLDTALRWAASDLRRRASLGPRGLAPLVEVCENAARTAREVEVFNLDRRPLVVSLFGDLAAAVRRTA